jgi:hypothetical protein
VQSSSAPIAPSIGIASQQVLDVNISEESVFEDADEELPINGTKAAEQAIDILWDELDHWDEDRQSENGLHLR